MSKAEVTLGGVPLAGKAGVTWRLVTGVSPFITTFEAHKNQWKRLESQVGRPLQLRIKDSRGDVTAVEKVYILHIVPSDSPNRVQFAVADLRWKWRYSLIARDYNIPRKTGSKTFAGQLPIQIQQIEDEFDFLPYSLRNGRERWTAKQAVEDVLDQIVKETDGNDDYQVESFPITGDGGRGQFSLQGVQLREQADAAMSRLLSYIPGAEVYVSLDGRIIVFDGTDLDAAEQHLKQLPPSTWLGNKEASIDRRVVRPSKIRLYYQREVELLVSYSDDYSGQTSAAPVRNAPYCENVIPTVAQETQIAEYDPEIGTTISRPVPPGTWVEMSSYFADLERRGIPSYGGTFWDALKISWLPGDLDGIDLFRPDVANDQQEFLSVQSGIQNVKQHFRQTFRISRRYMERIRSLRNVRAAISAPVTGARAPSVSWGQACVAPSSKGRRIAANTGSGATSIKRNLDFFALLNASGYTWDAPPGPVRVSMLDADLGIFRFDWIASPYGTEASLIPCLVVRQDSQSKVDQRDLSKQDEESMGDDTKVEETELGLQLSDTMRMRTVLTMVPNSPNNKRQFHVEEVTAGEVADAFSSNVRFEGGEGPVLEIFVPPSEVTARFEWADDGPARSTVSQLLGLNSEDPNEAGIDGNELPGFILKNGDDVIRGHAIAMAAEFLSPFADGVQGQIVTRGDSKNLKLVGNMQGATIQVAAAPSAAVQSVFTFPGQQRRISRLATMPESARRIILGTLPYD